jgi:hypothetical protein
MPGSADASPYVVTLEEVGSNVVATGSGAIDAAGLTPFESDSGIVSMPPQMEPNTGLIVTGAQGSAKIYKVSTLKGPSSFGNGSFFTGPGVNNPTGTGPVVEISGGIALFIYPTNTLRTRRCRTPRPTTQRPSPPWA